MDVSRCNFNNENFSTARTDESVSSFSYVKRNNGSLQLLTADFLAFSLLLREKLMEDNSINMSRFYDPFNNLNVLMSPGKQTNFSEDSTRKGRKLTPKEFNFFVMDNSDSNVSYFNKGNFGKHTFLESFRNTTLFHESPSDFHLFYSQFESYMIKLFSIHPTLGSSDRGTFIDEDGSMVDSVLNYIRFYESAMHLLSKKQRYYFYVSLFFLIVLLRNLRRFLHHYKSSKTLTDFIVIMVEAIYMCQNHLYKTFLSHWNKEKEQPLNKYTDLLVDQSSNSKGENTKLNADSLGEEELLKTYHSNCQKLKDSIYTYCREEAPDSQENTCQECIMEYNETTYNSEDDFVPDETEFPVFYDNIPPMLTKREEYFDSSLDYDNSEIRNLSNTNLLLDYEITKWISQMCKICSLYCKMGKGPVFLQKRFTKLVLDCETSVLPKLHTGSFTNLSGHRSTRARRRMRLPRSKRRELLTLCKELKTSSPEEDEPFFLPETPVSVRESQVEEPNQPVPPEVAKKQTKLESPTKIRNKTKRWSQEDTDLFVNAVNSHGIGNWKYISDKFFLGKRSDRQLKDKWKNLTRYRHVEEVEVGEKKVFSLIKWRFVLSPEGLNPQSQPLN